MTKKQKMIVVSVDAKGCEAFREQQTVHYVREFLAGGVSLDMVLIPGGRFLMGSPEDELERIDSEGPQHKVDVPNFCMGKYPVTQAQWKAVAAMPKVKRELQLVPSGFKGDCLPVERVSWNEAVEFCDRLTIYTNRQYRLPSEAEWEYACRAGTTTPFHFGETITTELTNYRGADNREYGWSGSYGDGPKGECREKTTPVDQFDRPNAYGLCDMHGNVWEWCQDHWHATYEGAPIDGSAWLTDDENAWRVYRGGSWLDDLRYCRAASRSFFNPVLRNFNIGFRVSCSAPRNQ